MKKTKNLPVLESFKSILSTRNFGEEAAREYRKRIMGRNFNDFIIDKVANKVGFTKREAKMAVECVFEKISDALTKGEPVRLVGFGTFGARQRAARMARNPRTGEKIQVRSMSVPFFKPGKELKEKLKQ